MNEILEKNLAAIEKKLPGWRAYIEEKKYELAKEDGEPPYIEHVEVKTETAYNGEKISRVYYKGKSCYLAGKYGPSRYAKYQADQVEDKGYGSVVLVLGFSDGRFLKELAACMHPEALVLVYEPCLEIFLHALREYDISELFSDRLVGVMVEGINGNEFTGMIRKSLCIENMTKFHIMIMENYENLFFERMNDTVEIVRKCMKQLRLQWNTMVNFTNQSIYNKVKNLRMLYDHYNFCILHRTLPKDVPAIIVGAGPSLDKNIDDLKSAKGRALIIACDTALKPLLSHGIVPDLFVVVDPNKPMELFEREEVWEIPLLTGLDVPYRVVERHHGKKILYMDAAIVGRVLQQVFGQQWNTPAHFMGGVPTGGNVASSGFSAARLMGARTIILVGQDMALTGEKEHAEGTLQADRRFDLDNKKFPRVESVDGERIPTLPILQTYLEWFEEQIRMYPGIQVVNATEGGAKVHGSRQMTLKEAIAEYCTNEDGYDVQACLEQKGMHFSKEDKEKACQWFSEMPERMKRLEKQVVKGGNYYGKLQRLAASGKGVAHGNMQEIKKLLDKIKKINIRLDKDEEAALIMDGLRGVEYTLRTQMYTFGDDEWKDLAESAQIGYRFMLSMQIVLRQMSPVFEEVAGYFREKAEELKC